MSPGYTLRFSKSGHFISQLRINVKKKDEEKGRSGLSSFFPSYAQAAHDLRANTIYGLTGVRHSLSRGDHNSETLRIRGRNALHFPDLAVEADFRCLFTHCSGVISKFNCIRLLKSLTALLGEVRSRWRKFLKKVLKGRRDTKILPQTRDCEPRRDLLQSRVSLRPKDF